MTQPFHPPRSREFEQVEVEPVTRPATLPFADRIVPPKEAWDRIRLEDYLDG